MKECPSFPGYSVTESGDVYTHRKRFGKGKGNGGGVRIDPNYSLKLNPYKAHGGYMYVAISTKGKMRSIPIHVLLMDAFVGIRLPNTQTRHLNGNPTNNQLENLAYGTIKQNSEDRTKFLRKTTLSQILKVLKEGFPDVWDECIGAVNTPGRRRYGSGG